MIESGGPIAHVARDLGVPSETLRKHVRGVGDDEGLRPGLPSAAAERAEIKALRREVYELRRAGGRVRCYHGLSTTLALPRCCHVAA